MKLIVCVSDLHINSTVGLCVPDVRLDDGGYYQLSTSQLWLWDKWLKFWEDAKGLKQLHNCQIYTVINGDAFEVDLKKRSCQHISTNLADIAKMGQAAIEPLLQTSDRVFIIRGTEAHVGLAAHMEEELGRSINAEMDGNNYSWYHLLMDVEGVRLEFAHHTTLGNTPWSRLSSPSRIANETIIHYYNSYDTVPNLVIRSHKHRYADTGQNFKRVRTIFTPAWQLSTAYIYTLSPATLADVGGLYISLDEGNINVDPIIYSVRPKPAWTDDHNRAGVARSYQASLPGDELKRYDIGGLGTPTWMESGQSTAVPYSPEKARQADRNSSAGT